MDLRALAFFIIFYFPTLNPPLIEELVQFRHDLLAASVLDDFFASF